jgi:MFS family permease
MINVAEYPLFVNLGGGSTAYGAAVSGWALGTFVASRVISRHGDAYSERRRLLRGSAVVSLAIGLCGIIPFVGAVVLLFSMAGFATGTRRIAATLIFQRWAPDHVRARVFSTLTSVNVGAIGLAMIVSGVVLAALTPAGVCIASGLIGLCALLIAMRIPPRRGDPKELSTIPNVARPSRSELSLAT